MPSKLKDNLNSRYFEAANALTSKQARRRIVAYVESYDDIYFWRTVLSRFEDEQRYFEVMLPSHKKLERGKTCCCHAGVAGRIEGDMSVGHTDCGIVALHDDVTLQTLRQLTRLAQAFVAVGRMS